MTRISVPEKGVESLFGTHDENLRLLERTFKVRIQGHGSELTIEGDERGKTLAHRALEQLAALMKEGYSVGAGVSIVEIPCPSNVRSQPSFPQIIF